MKQAYPAIFTPITEGYDVLVPDLPGCRTCAETLAEAIEMASDAASMWVVDAEDSNEEIPSPSNSVHATAPQFVNLVVVDTEEWRRINDSRPVKKTLSIPNWLNVQAEKANAPFSKILQEGLKQYLHLAD